MGEQPNAEDFYRQLEFSVERLSTYPAGADVIVERSPLDFMAYIRALADLRRERGCEELIEAAADLAARGMAHIDLLVFLPLDERSGVVAPESEDVELRAAMNECLAEIINNSYLPAIELRGARSARLATLESAARTTRASP